MRLDGVGAACRQFISNMGIRAALRSGYLLLSNRIEKAVTEAIEIRELFIGQCANNQIRKEQFYCYGYYCQHGNIGGLDKVASLWSETFPGIQTPKCSDFIRAMNTAYGQEWCKTPAGMSQVLKYGVDHMTNVTEELLGGFTRFSTVLTGLSMISDTGVLFASAVSDHFIEGACSHLKTPIIVKEGAKVAAATGMFYTLGASFMPLTGLYMASRLIQTLLLQ